MAQVMHFNKYLANTLRNCVVFCLKSLSSMMYPPILWAHQPCTLSLRYLPHLYAFPRMMTTPSWKTIPHCATPTLPKRSRPLIRHLECHVNFLSIIQTTPITAPIKDTPHFSVGHLHLSDMFPTPMRQRNVYQTIAGQVERVWTTALRGFWWTALSISFF